MGLLITVALFVAFRPSFGVQKSDIVVTPRRRNAAILIAGVGIGFYDGVFGPGVGTFLIISFTTLLATQFLESAAMAKVINASSNLGALAVFAWQGNVLWALGLGMAVGNIMRRDDRVAHRNEKGIRIRPGRPGPGGHRNGGQNGIRPVRLTEIHPTTEEDPWQGNYPVC